ncbi:hypothetical protein [Streptomyces sp. NPDC059378]|uniref:hypothetical protein n=1 Tax=Streptomyces sp. NPDC059378 TaxID=3346815 RepID=UPI0036860E55
MNRAVALVRRAAGEERHHQNGFCPDAAKRVGYGTDVDMTTTPLALTLRTDDFPRG